MHSRSTSEYIDVHCWRFTPTSFRLLLSDLQTLDLTGLHIKAEFDTTGCEFYVTLGKDGHPACLDRLDALQRLKAEDA
jgi:hypothetical protein